MTKRKLKSGERVTHHRSHSEVGRAQPRNRLSDLEFKGLVIDQRKSDRSNGEGAIASNPLFSGCTEPQPCACQLACFQNLDKFSFLGQRGASAFCDSVFILLFLKNLIFLPSF